MGGPKHRLRAAVSAVAAAQALSTPAADAWLAPPTLVAHQARGMKNIHFDQHLPDDIRELSPVGPWGIHFAKNSGRTFERLRINGSLTASLLALVLGWRVCVVGPTCSRLFTAFFDHARSSYHFILKCVL